MHHAPLSSPPLPLRRRRPTTTLQAAQKGYELLKKKADALKVRFRDIAKRIYATKVRASHGLGGATER